MDQIKQLQTKYLVLMEKAQKATGWKESVKYFHGALQDRRQDQAVVDMEVVVVRPNV